MADKQCAGWHERPHSTKRPVAHLELAAGKLLLCECCLRDYLHDPRVSVVDYSVARVALECLLPWLED